MILLLFFGCLMAGAVLAVWLFAMMISYVLSEGTNKIAERGGHI